MPAGSVPGGGPEPSARCCVPSLETSSRVGRQRGDERLAHGQVAMLLLQCALVIVWVLAGCEVVAFPARQGHGGGPVPTLAGKGGIDRELLTVQRDREIPVHVDEPVGWHH